MRYFSLFSTLLFLIGCGDDSSGTIDASTGADDAGTTDAQAVTDAQVAMDSGDEPDGASPDDMGMASDASMPNTDASLDAPDSGAPMPCPEGYTGEDCSECATGYIELRSGICRLTLPNESDLAYWFDASEIGSVQISAGTTVRAWEDRRDDTILARAPTIEARPNYDRMGLNDAPVIQFDDTGDALRVGEFTAFSSADYTLFVVASFEGGGTQSIISMDREEQNSFLLEYDGSANLLRVLQRPLGSETTDIVEADGFAVGPRIITVRRWTSALLDHFKLIANSDTDLNGIDILQEVTTSTIRGTFDLTIGNEFRGFRGDMAEIIIFRRVLMDDEVQQVREYLAAKWIPEALSSDE